jgi:N-glycosylase/DNA lyase
MENIQKHRTAVSELRREWRRMKGAIAKRLRDFREIGLTGSDEDLFRELVFCLFTPQSKAKSCWATVRDLEDRDLLLKGGKYRIACRLNRVRFRNNKAGYVIHAREQFTEHGRISMRRFLTGDAVSVREWLVRHVKGLGCKEASHFLRNIGKGETIAILDRHILKNLVRLGVVAKVPASLPPKTYLQIEDKMKAFAQKAGIPLSHLDLLLWCRETGEIFK